MSVVGRISDATGFDFQISLRNPALGASIPRRTGDATYEMIDFMEMTPAPTQPQSISTIERRIALFLSAVVLANYLRGVAPGLLGGDSGEFQFAAWRLGLAHATGYPLYLSLGWFWQRVLSMFGVDPAYALNVLSAIFAAITVVILYRLLVSWLPGSLPVRRLAALFAATWFAVNPTFWNQALIAEVYTLHALLIVLILWVVGRGGEGERRKRERETGDQRPTNTDHGSRITDHAIRNTQPTSLLPLSLLFGLSLTHHATALFLLPGLLCYILYATYSATRNTQHTIRNSFIFLITSTLPLLFYLYIPLRSGPNASPWYHIQLGTETISLYQNTWQSFFDFVTGRSISVGFTDLAGAWANLSQALTLWNIHVGWPGLVLAIFGLWALIRNQRWDVLSVSVPFFVILQLFNLFYNIGDILVYYIPLYLMAMIWAAFGAAQLGGWWDGGMGRQGDKGMEWQGDEKQAASDAQSPVSSPQSPTPEPQSAILTPQSPISLSLVILILLFLLPLQHYRTHQSMLDLSGMNAARTTWQAILDAKPATDGVLVSNDRNEIVPLYYLQSVEGRAQTLIGLFPLLTPDARFADIGSTLDTALTSGRPIYLIKPMPGLEVRFELAAANPPLVQVVGPTSVISTAIKVEQPYGPLTLLSYDWRQQGEGVQIDLFWSVNQRFASNQTTTVQVFDASGEKLGQDDRAPGGDFYPTSVWKVGETLRDRHLMRLSDGKTAVKFLVGMYSGAELTMLAPPLEVVLKP